MPTMSPKFPIEKYMLAGTVALALLLLIGMQKFNQRVPKAVHVEETKEAAKSDASSFEEQTDTRILPDEPEMVFVEGGSFMMGEAAKPVTVESFHIGKYEVTQRQWNLVMGTTVEDQLSIINENIRNTPYLRAAYPNGWGASSVGDNHPMYYVDWFEAQEYIRRLNETTGKQYRLPAEAEWEFAAHGGIKNSGYIYSGSNSIDDVAWHRGNSKKPHPVGLKQPNELGIYDMTGNLREWCQDLWDDYTSDLKNREKVRSAGFLVVTKGSSYFDSDANSRVAGRRGIDPDMRRPTFGFRLVHP